MAVAVAASLLVVGCATSSEWVKVRDKPRNPLEGTLDLVSSAGPKPTPRTLQLLRRYDLEGELKGDRAALIARLEDLQRREPGREHEYAIAEIAYITATQAENLHRQRAQQFHGTAMLHAYRYLFEPMPGRSDGWSSFALNAYDPQFRGACDLYNQSLEGLLRLVKREGEIRPGMVRTLSTANNTCSFRVAIHSTGWHEDDIDRLEFVSDYKIQGLQNHYHTYGLGVPLIAVRKPHPGHDAAEQYYPPNVCFPLTAFLRVEKPGESAAGTVSADEATYARRTPAAIDPAAPRFVLELYDPLDRKTIEVANKAVPLEADLSTPLAYFLNQPQFQDRDLSTVGLLHPNEAKKLQGLYMLEPYDPRKMPVVMVHGLWSSPITWMEMYNDLRSEPQVREHYQFWFYLYPTGQPFWNSATQMREDLAKMRRTVDPSRQAPALDQMVLVGHSMGGLIAKLQTVESADAFWQTVSDQPFAQLKANPETVRALATTYYFRPNPSIRRVVTLGTPHRGSPFANNITRWAGSQLIDVPNRMLRAQNMLLAENRKFFRSDAPTKINTSIESLAPDSPLLPPLLAASPGPWVSYHNVVGQASVPRWQKWFVGEGDGVVSVSSARLDNTPQLESQIVVPADHMNVHRHPQSVLEVRRLLFEQVAELENFPGSPANQVARRAEVAPPSVGQTPNY
ncbi:MAG: alpha/beta fold hydrolase [Pirellulales bacterium]|nr:alpha/beta fold hydrolase [Pirellulales bacterium]